MIPVSRWNLADRRPERIQALRQQLASWRESVSARIPSPPLLTEARKLYFAEHFNSEQLSERLWYNAQWKAENGILKRLENGTANTRIFLREADYQDCIIRFDFRMGHSRDVRLMTGSGGHYNTVLHIRPDHFFLQTAKDKSVPYFSYQHCECAFDFEPDRWYTMTVEFLGDEAIAHLDHKHIVHARHPIINRKREYFAFQVDEHVVTFDNVEILNAVAKKDETNSRPLIEASICKFPLKRSLQDEFNIRKANAHEWYYQRDEKYRLLIKQVDQLDESLKQRFPEAFLSHKEYRTGIMQERKRLLEHDAVYKEFLFATYRSNQAIDDWIISQNPKLDSLPFSQKKAAIDRLRVQYAGTAEMIAMEKIASQAQSTLEANYPQLFITDSEITKVKKASYDQLKTNPDFQRLTKERAIAYNTQQDYLLKTDDELKRLYALLHSAQK